jgi:hypothetical protein
VLLARFDLTSDLLLRKVVSSPVVRVVTALGAQARFDLGQLGRRAEASVGEAVLRGEGAASSGETSLGANTKQLTSSSTLMC